MSDYPFPGPQDVRWVPMLPTSVVVDRDLLARMAEATADRGESGVRFTEAEWNLINGWIR